MIWYLKGNSAKKNHHFLMVYILIAAALIGLIAALAAAVVTGIDNPPLMEEGFSVEVADGWQKDDGTLVTMPDFLDGSGSTRVSYTVILPQGVSEVRAPVLFFSSRYVNCSFYLDGKHLGDCLSKPPSVDNSQGKVLTAIPLPGDFAGRELRLDVELMLGKGVSYEIPAPVIGCRSSMGSAILHQDWLAALVELAILCFSLMLFLFGLQKGRMHQGHMFFGMGLFAMCFALYSLCTNDILHLFCPNSYLIYVLEFLLLAVLPIPIVIAFEVQSMPPLKRLLRVDAVILLCNVILQVVLHFFTSLEVRNTVFLTHGTMLITLPLLTAALVKGWRDPSKRSTIITFFPIFGGALIDLLLFYFSDFYRSSFWVKVGVMLFVLFQTYSMVKDYLKRCENALKAGFYQQMAYIDALTGLDNRAAFEQRISELKENLPGYSSLWCICADINNLKQVNDNAGHSAGDIMIQGAAAVLKVIPPSESAVYRTGGDEFVIFIINESEQVILEGLHRLDEALEKYNRTHTIPVSLAVGWDNFRFGCNDTVPELVSRADKKMYENKRRYKEKTV